MSSEFAWSAEQVELRRTVRAFAAEVSPQEEVRRLMASPLGHDPAVWSRLGEELGVLGLATDEEYDGVGDGLVSQAVVIEELGRALVCGPLLGSIILGATALGGLSDKAARAELLPGLVAGRTTAALAAPLHRGGFDPAAVTVTATARPGTAAPGGTPSSDGTPSPGGAATAGYTLRGSVAHVLDGAAADLLLVAAAIGGTDGNGADGDGAAEGKDVDGDKDGYGGAVGLFAVSAEAAGLVRQSTPTMDLTRRQATVSFNDVPARLLAAAPEAAAVLATTAETAAVLLAAEQVGAAQYLLDLSVEYARTRLQFGRPIGSFQAVKHLCADMLVLVEQARSVAYHGAWALDEGTDDPRIAASLAQSVCSTAFTQVAAMAVQVHGGIGFTWEHPAHLYLKRAYTDAALFGGAEAHQERLAQLVLDDTDGR
ncbi:MULTISPECIES: acyl-CoA dehydrogenase family protein [Frankia]|uniref:Acyl-CoA dehydrogenase n=1 Tax=Frankia alni (strain DSM 45986 / CECT 9034 / ACN14a) TaxID=326424 RepID=Q0RTP3_FRAAA|nr:MULTISPECIES: acyl-CoA dehydrogenase family protein [Frankia]CAJ59055.1 putative acyl-CoA dehydrogenase [Frankia alni ACN14a]